MVAAFFVEQLPSRARRNIDDLPGIQIRTVGLAYGHSASTQKRPNSRIATVDSPLAGRAQFGYDDPAVGDLDSLSPFHYPDVVAESILEFSDSNGSHMCVKS